MNLIFKELHIRNFLSYGNNLTKIKLDFDTPTLIVGQNHDSIVEGQIDSNGAGKSAILNAIAFCLYDKTISDIEKADIVNNINNKNMEVAIIFSVNGVHYKVERYRKNKLKGGDGVRIFSNTNNATFTEEHDKTPDSVQNSNRFIEEIIGMPFEIFSRIVLFSATYEPFLSLPSSHASKANQRDIIEELFGLTELSRKAETLKEMISKQKTLLTAEKNAYESCISERSRIETQLQSTIQKSNNWVLDTDIQIETIKTELQELESLDVDRIATVHEEIKKLDDELKDLYNDRDLIKEKLSTILSNNKSHDDWEDNNKLNIKKTQEKLSHYSGLDVPYLKGVVTEKAELERNISIHEHEKKVLTKELAANEQLLNKLNTEIDSLKDSMCPYCNQSYKDAKIKHDNCVEQIETVKSTIAELKDRLSDNNNKLDDYSLKYVAIKSIPIPINLDSIQTAIVTLESTLENLQNTSNPFKKKSASKLESTLKLVTDDIASIQDSIKKLKSEIDLNVDITSLQNEINALKTKMDMLAQSKNPYTAIIDELTSLLDNEMAKPDPSKMDEAANMLEHQEFLYKLLTKKDSFIRKALLNKNIPFLNTRMSLYLSEIGLSHKVLFTEEMGAKITQFGTEYKFSNLSSGQKARVNLALAFAFRDVLQARFSKINLCVLDECLDTGLGNVGVQLAAKMIKRIAANDKLSMFVISHRDEIASMFTSKLEIELKRGFSTVKPSPLLLSTPIDQEEDVDE